MEERINNLPVITFSLVFQLQLLDNDCLVPFSMFSAEIMIINT